MVQVLEHLPPGLLSYPTCLVFSYPTMLSSLPSQAGHGLFLLTCAWNSLPSPPHVLHELTLVLWNQNKLFLVMANITTWEKTNLMCFLVEEHRKCSLYSRHIEHCCRVVGYGGDAILAFLVCQSQVLKQLGLGFKPQGPAVNPSGWAPLLSALSFLISARHWLQVRRKKPRQKFCLFLSLYS